MDASAIKTSVFSGLMYRVTELQGNKQPYRDSAGPDGRIGDGDGRAGAPREGRSQPAVAASMEYVSTVKPK